MKHAWKVAAALLVCAIIGVWATSASSNDPPLRDTNGRPITPGTIVADLVRGADGHCRPRPGQDLGVAGKAQPGESGSVTIRVDEATCKLVVSRVDTAAASDPPTGQVTDSGSR